MIGDTRPISLKVVGEGGSATSRQAESLGFIVTELVMNALKHAFPDEKVEGRITVAYDIDRNKLEAFGLRQWDRQAGRRLCSSQNPDSEPASSKRWRINSMLRLKLWPALQGTTVSITHATFPTKIVQAA